MRFIFLSLIILLCFQSVAQDFRILAGLRLRPTPSYVGNRSFRTAITGEESGILFQQDKHLTGFSLPVSGRLHFEKIGFMQISLSIRHDELLTIIDPTVIINNRISRFFYDFSVAHNIPVFSIADNSILYIGAGFSWNNFNSDYTFPIKDPRNSSTIMGYRTRDLRFTTIDIPITLDYKRASFSITPTYTIKQQFPLLTNNFIALNCVWQYRFFKAQKH